MLIADVLLAVVTEHKLLRPIAVVGFQGLEDRLPHKRYRGTFRHVVAPDVLVRHIDDHAVAEFLSVDDQVREILRP